MAMVYRICIGLLLLQVSHSAELLDLHTSQLFSQHTSCTAQNFHTREDMNIMHMLPKFLRTFVMQMFDSFPQDICKLALAIPAALAMESFAQHVA